MRVWTVQPVNVWEQLQQDGKLTVDKSRLPHNGYVPPQYHWLAEHLKNRLPEYRGELPWWAYCEKPDLRRVRHYRPSGKRQVRIELEVSHEEAFAMPCWAWHTVYCGDYLSVDREEHDDWVAQLQKAVPDEDTWPLPQPWKAELEASWERLFDPTLIARSWDRESEFGTEREAVFGTIRLTSVRGVTFFTGAFRRR